jgi:signal transduction histidine kinase
LGDGPLLDNLDTLLVATARALSLDRAALLLERGPVRALVPVAVYGRVALGRVPLGAPPGDGPWSLVFPLTVAGHQLGVLLLARDGGAPLPAADQALAARLAALIGTLVGNVRLRAELEHARALLARADRLAALGTLAASLAHEIRNPLVSVRTFIQLLPERLDDTEYRTTFRDLALDEIERICGLITDLLAFSRPAPTQREPTDLNEIVGQVARLLEAEARKCDVRIVRRQGRALPTVVVDDARIKQVLMNVILNAIEACGRNGVVEIATETVDRAGGCWCVVTVSDSGTGIAPEHRDSIFEPFFTTKNAGSGLGLFIARAIVTDHGGHITTGPRVGGGTVFAIHFPLVPSEDAHAGSF